MDIIFATNNYIEGLIIGAKFIGYMLAAALILYFVLVLTRFAGNKFNRKMYAKYKAKYILEHNGEDCMMTYEEYVLSKKNIKIIDRQSIDDQQIQLDIQTKSKTDNLSAQDINDNKEESIDKDNGENL